jgi:LacI family transcriptional regulator
MRGGDVEAEVARDLIANGIDGIILPPLWTAAPGPHRQELHARGGGRERTSDKRLCAIGIDDYRAAYEMTRHIISLGHLRIGFIAGHPNQTASARRLAGFRDAMAGAGLEVPASMMAQGMFNYRSGLDAAEALLSAEPRPTAIFASNDDMAAASVAIAHRVGLDVPGDLTVAGFDDAALATTIWPELTTVHQPISDMASAAVEILVRQVRARRAGDAVAPEQVTMDFSLIRRQSDAAPRVRPPGAFVREA